LNTIDYELLTARFQWWVFGRQSRILSVKWPASKAKQAVGSEIDYQWLKIDLRTVLVGF
jgi:hypothetical protein